MTDERPASWKACGLQGMPLYAHLDNITFCMPFLAPSNPESDGQPTNNPTRRPEREPAKVLDGKILQHIPKIIMVAKQPQYKLGRHLTKGQCMPYQPALWKKYARVPFNILDINIAGARPKLSRIEETYYRTQDCHSPHSRDNA